MILFNKPFKHCDKCNNYLCDYYFEGIPEEKIKSYTGWGLMFDLQYQRYGGQGAMAPSLYGHVA